MSNKCELLRQRIVAAADQLFYQQGYENTSFSDIANEVNISRGNFYYHFKSKDDILNAVIDKRLGDIENTLHEWEKNSPDPKNRILSYINMLHQNKESITKHGCPVGVMCTELNKLNHLMHSDVSRLHLLFKNWLSKQFKELGHKKDAQNLAMHLLSRAQGIASITSAFEDKSFLKREIKTLTNWLENIS